MSSDYVYQIFTDERRQEELHIQLEQLERDIYSLDKEIASGKYDQSEVQHLTRRRNEFIARANALKPDVPTPPRPQRGGSDEPEPDE